MKAVASKIVTSKRNLLSFEEIKNKSRCSGSEATGGSRSRICGKCGKHEVFSIISTDQKCEVGDRRDERSLAKRAISRIRPWRAIISRFIVIGLSL